MQAFVKVYPAVKCCIDGYLFLVNLMLSGISNLGIFREKIIISILINCSNYEASILRLNKTYRRHLIKSFLIVIIGMVLIVKGIYPDMAISDNYFVLLMAILSAFLAFFGIVVFYIRMGKIKFRRKFMYSFSGVANFCIGGISIFFALLYKTAGTLSMVVYAISFLVGVVMLADVFFGKRSPRKYENEMLIE